MHLSSALLGVSSSGTLHRFRPVDLLMIDGDPNRYSRADVDATIIPPLLAAKLTATEGRDPGKAASNAPSTKRGEHKEAYHAADTQRLHPLRS
jgi:hypothetical protein